MAITYTKGISNDSGLSLTGNGGNLTLIDPNKIKQSFQGYSNLGSGNPNFDAAYLKSLVRASMLGTRAFEKLAPVQVVSKEGNYSASAPGANPYGVKRNPWIFATFADVTAAGGYITSSNAGPALPSLPLANLNNENNGTIVWYANPKSVEWSIAQRGSEAKTKAGTVLHVWRDRLRQTDYDDPKITMTFQTGGIQAAYSNATNPAIVQGQPDVAIPPGLDNFYKFLKLVDTSKVKNGAANTIHILYRSAIFPSMMITGFFDPQSVVRFTDTADNPFQVTGWSATFTIYKTVPAFNDWAQLKSMFMREFKNSPFNDAKGRHPYNPINT